MFGQGFVPGLEVVSAVGAAHPLDQQVTHIGILGMDHREGDRARVADRLTAGVKEVPGHPVRVHAEALSLRALVAEEELERAHAERHERRHLVDVLALDHHDVEPKIDQRPLVAPADSLLSHLDP